MIFFSSNNTRNNSEVMHYIIAIITSQIVRFQNILIWLDNIFDVAESCKQSNITIFAIFKVSIQILLEVK